MESKSPHQISAAQSAFSSCQPRFWCGGKPGYVALISAVIISVILMAIVFTLSFTGYFGRFNVLESEFKERGAGLAEACADRALLKLANNPSYTGNETLSIEGNLCTIQPIQSSPPNKIIKTQAVFHDSYTNLRVTVDAATLVIASWEELPSL